MEVNVEVQTSEALNEIYRAALRVLDPVAPGARAVPGEDRLDEDARERRQHVGLERGEPAKLVGQREHVLPHGHVRQDSIDQVRRDVCHASTAAARADAAAVAREGDEQIVAAGVAVSPREPLGKVTAMEVCGTPCFLTVAETPIAGTSASTAARCSFV